MASDPVLHRRLERIKFRHPAFERRGGVANAYPKPQAFDSFSLPERLLGPVETERCRIDSIVMHPLSRQPLDRPWLTTLFDCTTRIILDAQLSFEPSFPTPLQRALAHAFRKMDRSSLDGLTHD
ncbi:hypothetical protein ACIU1J_25640 [Azospirillum doebereinerae]|uniref:hypothetical protein n=1 Tax=Azospirillum doebereinerae TaxID=92933 RepID=UPI001EE5A9D7|nr:hypothetical protein [Azospirillum doebereinerae]MCG5243865.1 hypothetical protein [Azospirillum doebereinerae]